MRKELIRPEAALFADEEAFRFRHLLSRDAAYDALPKATRAELHERFADWLDEHGAGLVELDEMLGYHLEQAARFNEELGRPGDALAERAAARLGAAGVRALDRGDMVGAINLLGRATALLPPTDDARIELELELGEALQEAGRLAEAESLLEQTAVQAARSDQPLIRLRPQLGLVSVRMQTRRREGASTDSDVTSSRWWPCSRRQAIIVTRRTLSVCSGCSPAAGTEAADLQERALAHALQAGDERRAQVIARHIAAIALWGPEPVPSPRSPAAARSSTKHRATREGSSRRAA